MYRDLLQDISIGILRRGYKENYTHFVIISDRVPDTGDHLDSIEDMIGSTEALEMLLEADAVLAVSGVRVLQKPERDVVFRSLGMKEIAKYKQMLAKYAPVERGIQYLKDERQNYLKNYQQIRGLIIGFKITNEILDRNTIDNGRYLWIDIKDNKYSIDESQQQNLRLFYTDVVEPALLDSASTIKHLVQQIKKIMRNGRIKSAAFISFLNGILEELKANQTDIHRLFTEVKAFKHIGIKHDFRYTSLNEKYIDEDKIDYINTILKNHSK